MSNMGKCLKLFYSENDEVNGVIRDLIDQWPYGFSKYVTNPDDYGNECWSIKIEPCDSLKSTSVVISAYMHMRCGFSMFEHDRETMQSWIDSGDTFKEIEIQGDVKEIVYDCWHALKKEEKKAIENGFEINGTIMTSIADTLSMDDFTLLDTVCGKFAKLHYPNTCFLPNNNKVVVKIHLALKKKPVAKFNENEPVFLRG